MSPIRLIHRTLRSEIPFSTPAATTNAILNDVNSYNSGKKYPYAFLGTTNGNAFTCTLLAHVQSQSFFGKPKALRPAGVKFCGKALFYEEGPNTANNGHTWISFRRATQGVGSSERIFRPSCLHLHSQ